MQPHCKSYVVKHFAY